MASKRISLEIKDEVILELINSYTREAGVRNLERNIGSLCRYVATEIAKGTKQRATIRKSDLAKILGPIRFESEVALRSGVPGVVTGLAYTPVGGEVLFIEAASMPGKGNLMLTGQIGDVMKESAQAAFSLVKSNAKKLKLDPKKFAQSDYHIHVPAGAVPKDGPSAGIAMFTSFASLLLNKAVRPDIAMTGEITLQGLGASHRRPKGKDSCRQTRGHKNRYTAAPEIKRIWSKFPRLPKKASNFISSKIRTKSSNLFSNSDWPTPQAVSFGKVCRQ